MKKLLWLVFTCSLWANDGAYTMSGNQLIPIHESNISIQKEILTIKRIKDGVLDVKVEYTFFNPSEAKTVLVGFEAASPHGDVNGCPKQGEHPYMTNFSVLVNNKRLSYKVATHNGTNNYMKNGKIVSENVVCLNVNEPDIAYVYYFDVKFEKGENSIVHHYKYTTSSSLLASFEIDYILTAAKRWANKQIDDFTLILDMGEYTEFFITKSFFKDNRNWTLDGVIKDANSSYMGRKGSYIYLDKGMAVFHKKNFKIDGELEIFSESLDGKLHRTMDMFDFKKDKLPFMQEEVYEVYIESFVAKDTLSMQILKNLPYARRGYVFKNLEIQKYYEGLDWYEKRPTYEAKKSDWTKEEKDFYQEMHKKSLHILQNLPYAKRGHAFETEHLKIFFEAQTWYKKEEYKVVGILELAKAEKKWLKRIKSMHSESDIAFYALIDEYEKIFEKNSEHITYVAATNYPVSEDAIEKVKDVNVSMFQGSYHFGESDGESTMNVLCNNERLYANDVSGEWVGEPISWKVKNIRVDVTFENGKLNDYELYQAINDEYTDFKKGDKFLLSKSISYLNGKTYFYTQLNYQRTLTVEGKYPETSMVKLTENDLSVYKIDRLKEMLDEVLSRDKNALVSNDKLVSDIVKHNIELLRMELVAWYPTREDDKSMEIYKKVLVNNPKKAEAFLGLGSIYKRRKEYDKAIDSYQKAIEVDAECEYAYYHIGDCFYEKKEYNKAINAFEKELKTYPNEAETHYMLGIVYDRIDKYDKAIRCYKKAIAISLNLRLGHPAIYHLGNTYRHKKKYRKSIVAYKKSIEEDFRRVDSYNNIGLSYVDLKEYGKAIEAYEEAIKLDPKYAIAYHNMGVLYSRNDQKSKAITLYKKAVNLNPVYTQAYHNMGTSYMILNEYDKAIEAYRKAIIINPKYLDSYFGMGLTYKYQKDYISSILTQQKARNLNPKYKKIIFSKAMNKKALHILKNMPYAKRGYVFNDSDLKMFFEAQMWYKKNVDYVVKIADLSQVENVWLEKVQALGIQDKVALFELMDEYVALKLADTAMKMY